MSSTDAVMRVYLCKEQRTSMHLWRHARRCVRSWQHAGKGMRTSSSELAPYCHPPNHPHCLGMGEQRKHPVWECLESWAFGQLLLPLALEDCYSQAQSHRLVLGLVHQRAAAASPAAGACRMQHPPRSSRAAPAVEVAGVLDAAGVEVEVAGVEAEVATAAAAAVVGGARHGGVAGAEQQAATPAATAAVAAQGALPPSAGWRDTFPWLRGQADAHRYEACYCYY